MNFYRSVISILIFLQSQIVFANIFTVTNTNDSGSGSLREAIVNANFMSGSHTIEFNIPTSDQGYNSTTGVWIITPLTTFIWITSENILIDGTTQTANQGDTNPYGPEIVLDGNDNTIDYAFSLVNASNIKITGFTISNFLYGIQIYGASSVNNTISGNYIGINPTASDTAGNYIGIEITGGSKNNTVGGTDPADRNIVSGNEHIGIRIVDADSNIVIGNYVGLDRTGTYALGNYDGISIEGAAKYNIVGGTSPEERNIVAGNYAYGIPIFGAGCDHNLVIGNYIGTDITGTISIPNTYGVLFDDGAANNTVGGEGPEYRNIISGNSGYGVFIYNIGTNSNLVKGNFIGTDVSGTTALPNANGIVIDGAALRNTIDSNLISGNLQQGIVIHITGSDSNLVVRNIIGADISGNADMGNGYDGIRIAEGPKYNIIGGSPEEANIIAFNGSCGVSVMNDNDDFNKISCNSIYQNGGLGIDLFPSGVTANDAGDNDEGPNQGMNYPEIDSISYNSGNNETIIYGTLDTDDPENILIEIFLADTDRIGFGEGKTYLSTVTPDTDGNWSDTLYGLNAEDYLTTTATDENNNTSEFSESKSSDPTHIEEYYPVSGKNIFVYPNPASDHLNIILPENNTDNIIVILKDVAGKSLTNIGIHKATQHIYKYDISELSNGVYVIEIKTGNSTFSQKVCIIK